MSVQGMVNYHRGKNRLIEEKYAQKDAKRSEFMKLGLEGIALRDDIVENREEMRERAEYAKTIGLEYNKDLDKYIGTHTLEENQTGKTTQGYGVGGDILDAIRIRDLAGDEDASKVFFGKDGGVRDVYKIGNQHHAGNPMEWEEDLQSIELDRDLMSLIEEGVNFRQFSTEDIQSPSNLVPMELRSLKPWGERPGLGGEERPYMQPHEKELVEYGRKHLGDERGHLITDIEKDRALYWTGYMESPAFGDSNTATTFDEFGNPVNISSPTVREKMHLDSKMTSYSPFEALDTEMRVVKGEASKVTPEEANLIDRLGTKGENIVHKTGAGVRGSDGFKHYYQQQSGIGQFGDLLGGVSKLASNPATSSMFGASAGAVASFAGPAALALGAADYLQGSYNQAAQNREQIDNLGLALDKLDSKKSQLIEDFGSGVANIQENLGRNIGDTSLVASSQLRNMAANTVGMKKRAKGLETGASDISQNILTADISDKVTSQADSLFAKTQSDIKSFSDSSRSKIEDIGYTQKSMEDEIKLLKENDSFLETSGLASIGGMGILGYAAHKKFGG